MFGGFSKRRFEREARALAPTATELNAILHRAPCLAGLDGDQRERLGLLAGRILASKDFLGAGDLAPDRGDCLPVAVHAALPVLELGLDALRGFSSFILYRDAFEVEFEDIDEHGLVHRGRDLRAGEAWHGGPVVISLADTAESGHGDGFHVVIHELAHQIDSLNGEPDGFPPLPRDIPVSEWSRAFRAAFDRFQRRVDAGEDTELDPYAAESPAEFFAVCSEALFDAPGQLIREMPEIHALLKRFYRQDPYQRLADQVY